MDNMYQKGLRPFQNIIYVTESIYNQLDWKGHVLGDLFSFPKIITSLGEEDILTFLALNSNDPSRPYLLNYPVTIGLDYIYRVWNKSINLNDESNDDINYHSFLKKLRDSVLVNIHYSAAYSDLKLELEEPTKETDGFKLIHDESNIFVVLRKNDRNLLNKKSLNKTLKSLVREILITYTSYHDYNSVSTTPWFSLYIEQL